MEKLECIGESLSFHLALEKASRISKLNRPLLIIGERGTGKEVVANRVHYLSPVWDGPFVKINCATLTDELLNSELFGHEVGSFTGATRLHLGKFERANNGTIFLDEIANTSLSVQEKILRVIEYGEYERVGGNEVLKTNARIIAATNVDLPEYCKKGKFRADLLDRLAFDVVTLPPLRERIEDINPLARHFALKMVKELKLDHFSGFSESVVNKLHDYSWPGNVRELKNVIERAIYLNDHPEMPIDSLVFDPFESPYRPLEQDQNESENRGDEAPKKSSDLYQKLLEYKTLPNLIEYLEKELIKESLVKNRHNQKECARFLGLTYDQFRGRLKKYDL